MTQYNYNYNDELNRVFQISSERYNDSISVPKKSQNTLTLSSEPLPENVKALLSSSYQHNQNDKSNFDSFVNQNEPDLAHKVASYPMIITNDEDTAGQYVDQYPIDLVESDQEQDHPLGDKTQVSEEASMSQEQVNTGVPYFHTSDQLNMATVTLPDEHIKEDIV